MISCCCKSQWTTKKFRLWKIHSVRGGCGCGFGLDVQVLNFRLSRPRRNLYDPTFPPLSSASILPLSSTFVEEKRHLLHVARGRKCELYYGVHEVVERGLEGSGSGRVRSTREMMDEPGNFPVGDEAQGCTSSSGVLILFLLLWGRRSGKEDAVKVSPPL